VAAQNAREDISLFFFRFDIALLLATCEHISRAKPELADIN
jgi:hypothetical protein